MGEGDTVLATVEVMDADTLHWSTLSNLPQPLSDASATVCRGKVYIAGGKDKQGHQIKSVFTCSLSALLKSKEMESVWNTVVDLPVKGSTCVTLNGQLLAVSGRDSHEKPTNNIYTFNTKINSWEIISRMPTSRYWCLMAVLPANKLRW